MSDQQDAQSGGHDPAVPADQTPATLDDAVFVLSGRHRALAVRRGQVAEDAPAGDFEPLARDDLRALIEIGWCPPGTPSPLD